MPAFGKATAPRPGLKELLQDQDLPEANARALSPDPSLDRPICKRMIHGRNSSPEMRDLLGSPRIDEPSIPRSPRSPREGLRDEMFMHRRRRLESDTQSSAAVHHALLETEEVARPGEGRERAKTVEQVHAERRDRSPFSSGVKGRIEASVNMSPKMASLLRGDENFDEGEPQSFIGISQIRRLQEQRGACVAAAHFNHNEDMAIQRPSQNKMANEQMQTSLSAGQMQTSLSAAARSSVAKSCRQMSELRARAEIFQLRDMPFAKTGSLAGGTGRGPAGSFSRSQLNSGAPSPDLSRRELLWEDCRDKVATAVASIMNGPNGDPGAKKLTQVIQPPLNSQMRSGRTRSRT